MQNFLHSKDEQQMSSTAAQQHSRASKSAGALSLVRGVFTFAQDSRKLFIEMLMLFVYVVVDGFQLSVIKAPISNLRSRSIRFGSVLV